MDYHVDQWPHGKSAGAGSQGRGHNPAPTPPLSSIQRVLRVQKRIGTRHHSARARLTSREIAVVRPSTARGNRIDMSRKAHEMRLPRPFAHRPGEISIQTDTDERWFLSVCVRHEGIAGSVLLFQKEVTTPAVLPAVPYRGVRRRQRRGAKPSGQRILTRKGGDRSASRGRDCQHRGGRGPGARGMANPGEPPQAS